MRRLNKKMNESPRHDDTALQKLMALVEQYGNTCRALGFVQGRGDKGELGYAKRKSQQLLDDIKEHAESFMSYTAYDGKEEFEESGSEECETEWFDKMGDMKKHLPMDCILDCSGSGRVDDQVAYWVDELGFDIDLPRNKAIKFLSEYGAWEPDELENMDIIELAEKVLWIFCGNIKDEAYEFCRDGSEWDYVDKDSYPDDIDDWGEEDWGRFQDEVAICHLGM